MAKRTKQDDETRAAIEQLENEGGPASDSAEDEARIFTYRGGHPMIRRCGHVFTPRTPTRVPARVASILRAVPDFEDTTPAAPPDGDSELPPAA